MKKWHREALALIKPECTSSNVEKEVYILIIVRTESCLVKCKQNEYAFKASLFPMVPFRAWHCSATMHPFARANPNVSYFSASKPRCLFPPMIIVGMMI